MFNLTPLELLRAILRRWMWILPPILLGLGGAFALLRILPKTYTASTLVVVEKQKVPTDYVKATVTTTMEDRVRTVEQQVNNRNILARIIKELDLYPELRKQASMADVIEKVRKDLKVVKQGDSLFGISYTYVDPKKAAAVANRSAEMFIDDSLKQRATQAEGTSTFLEAELAETKGRLESQEARIAAFKQSYMGELPEQSETNLKMVESMQGKLEICLGALDKAEQRKLYVQTQIAQGRDAALPLRPGSPVVPPASRLDVARGELANLLTQYTERHPDVVRKREEIVYLEKEEREKKSAALAAAAADAAAGSAPATPVVVDPILRAELESVNLEIRSLQSERDRVQGQIAEFQSRLENVPRVEQQLLSLTRDYDNIKKSYDSLLEKRLNARLAENLEKSQQAEQFTILEKAIPPDVPSGPNALVILAAGLAFGGVLGLCLAVVLELMDSTYPDPDALQTAFPGVPVLATIPLFTAATVGTGRFSRS